MSKSCPKCGYEIDERANFGEGSKRGRNLKKLCSNKQAILRLLLETEKPLTVKEVQRTLYNSGVKRKMHGGEVLWNYHLVQAELSLLVGAGLVKMSKPDIEEDEDGVIHTKPGGHIPEYGVRDKIACNAVLERGGLI